MFDIYVSKHWLVSYSTCIIYLSNMSSCNCFPVLVAFSTILSLWTYCKSWLRLSYDATDDLGSNVSLWTVSIVFAKENDGTYSLIAQICFTNRCLFEQNVTFTLGSRYSFLPREMLAQICLTECVCVVDASTGRMMWRQEPWLVWTNMETNTLRTAKTTSLVSPGSLNVHDLKHMSSILVLHQNNVVFMEDVCSCITLL